MLDALLAVAMIACAILAVRARRLLHAAIWLAILSALVSVVLYRLGAEQVAVIELSVGAGLVTVLFVFAIGIAGDEQIRLKPLIPVPLAAGMVILSLLLLGWLALPFGGDAEVVQGDTGMAVESITAAPATEAPVEDVIWEQRGLDVLVQVVLIFSGVLGLLGLLAEAKGPLQKPLAEEVAARRDRELLALEASVLEQEREKELA